MKNFLTLSFLFFLVFSCNFSGINDTSDNEQAAFKKDSVLIELPVLDSLILESGIIIKYTKHGIGDSLKKGDIVMIDYSCRLEDGKVFDTNKKIGKPIPFMVGWKMQTKGWDQAFELLRIGDQVEIFLPADLARGKTGIPGSVPPNANNWLTLTVIEKKEPDLEIDGVQVYVFERDKDAKKIQRGDELELDYIAYSASKPRYSSSFENGVPFAFKVGSGSNLPGLNMALENAYFNDMLWVFIPSKHAFGAKGSLNNVKPNEPVLFDLLISEPMQ